MLFFSLLPLPAVSTPDSRARSTQYGHLSTRRRAAGRPTASGSQQHGTLWWCCLEAC